MPYNKIPDSCKTDEKTNGTILLYVNAENELSIPRENCSSSLFMYS
jgi:hypothetical protein